MAVVFLLGPSEWRQSAASPTPMDVRRELKAILEARNHGVVLMEDVEESAGEDLVDKFERILDTKEVDYVVLYWPKGAKMQTTYDELLLLRKRAASNAVPPAVDPSPRGSPQGRQWRIQPPGARRPKPVPGRRRPAGRPREPMEDARPVARVCPPPGRRTLTATHPRVDWAGRPAPLRFT
ncbi:MAG TPA: hypothetical protein VI818_02885 [Candidatus Thermoplasmatota archaeon]|nr:hypothetical protein [Candidatus Thermoplasmatota archaeon]